MFSVCRQRLELLGRYERLEESSKERVSGVPKHASVVIHRPPQLLTHDLLVAPAYVLIRSPITERFRLAVGLADSNLAVVAGPARLRVTSGPATARMETIVGPKA